MSQPSEMYDPAEPTGAGEPARPEHLGTPAGGFPAPAPVASTGPSTRTWVLWGLWRSLLLAISVTGFVTGEGAWRWVWAALLGSIVLTSWLARPGRKAPVPKALSEPGDHRVVLQIPGDKPILVIRALRRITGADLVAAKTMVESAPVVVAENLSRESAAQAAHLLTAAGARASVSQMEPPA